MAFQAKPYLQDVSIRWDGVSDRDRYPFNIPAVRNLSNLGFHPDVTFLVGENGAGKSTILEAIALALGFSPEGGTKNVQFETAQTTSSLHNHLQLARSHRSPKDHYFLRAESFFNVATYMDEVNYLATYGGKSLHQRSHGESFMALLTLKLKGKGLYLLDEPEAALSPTRQLAAILAIHQLVENESQFIIATHSPILLSYPRSKIMLLSDSGLTEVAYEETEHYAVTRDFLDHYRQRLDMLLDGETS